eukprot:1133190-Amphidinium_carterae.1
MEAANTFDELCCLTLKAWNCFLCESRILLGSFSILRIGVVENGGTVHMLCFQAKQIFRTYRDSDPSPLDCPESPPSK